MGTSSILFGNNDTPYAASNTKVTHDFFDTGFYSIDETVNGKIVTLRREGASSSTSNPC